ncbi:cytochrome c oxidase subunit I [Blastomonas aquatica]|uniref:Cytochrome c oxidase subunit I n=1 Tax=Blastomonas aquatica TaxID=1510276 RepID=A0ABQ1IZX2_9SPHN|nr:cytochrome c oxidase subunit I [Blastomonas aquatica]GGB55204.1 cytochrome c oxidase subunit I [Blastomonas aquatica]
MTQSTASDQPHDPAALHAELDTVWKALPGWRGFVSEVNHGAIGLRFMITAIIYFAIGGVLAMLIRVQLASPRAAFVGPDIYNQLFTMHGTIMMFLFAIPMLEGLALYLLPKVMGARDMAYPRLSALGWWCYALGGAILLVAMLAGVAPDGGWFMYTPLSDKVHTPGINADVWLLGVTFVEISAICAAVEITVSILKVRAEGMSLVRLPLFAWYMLGTAAMMLIGFPPLILGSILLEVQRAFDWAFFDPMRGGDPILWQHLFWLFGHPEVYIIFLPAAGALSMMIATFARQPLIGHAMIVAAIWAMVFLSFGLWVHHMFTIGIPHLALAFFSAASMLVAVPTSIQIFAWIGTLWSGRPRWSLPMLYIAGFFLTFVLGGLTGVMLAAVPFNWQAHDTAFVTAHLHYVLIGGFVFPMLAAITYWMPHFTGRRAVPGMSAAAFWMILIGVHGTFLVMHLTGLLGMPRRVSIYPDNPEWELLNLISSVGGFIMTAGFALFAADMGLQFLMGRRTRRNPWRATSLDWAMRLPPPSYNLASLPRADMETDERKLSPARLDTLATTLAMGEGLLPGAPRGVRETLIVDAISGRSEAVAVLPSNTMRPMVTALTIGVFFLAMLAGLYWVAAAVIVLIAAVCASWIRLVAPAHAGYAPVPDRIESLPASPSYPHALGWWGSAVLLTANASLFGSLLFAVAFLAVVAPGWNNLPADDGPGFVRLAALLVMGTGGALLLWAALRSRHAGHGGHQVVIGAGVLAVTAGALGVGWTMNGSPTEHARFAVQGAILAYLIAHTLILVTMHLAAARGHRIGVKKIAIGGVLAQWHGYTGAVTLIGALALAVSRL